MKFGTKSIFASITIVALAVALVLTQIELRDLHQQLDLCDWHLSDAKTYIRLSKKHNRFDGPAFARIIDKKSGEPIPGVIVNMTLIGPDGGDGGFQQFLTDADGYAHLTIPVEKGRYQYHLDPGPDSPFAQRVWARNEPYVKIDNEPNMTPVVLNMILRDTE